ncbi:DNA repair protein RadC [Corticibacter populi]|uniref:DNA repair protein RadC n=1 Tax=Corticibacter populi TaxID=1550736 RepID=A0A3M6QUT3_9BURK|nr:DNA repair protein RadC [Corticibacter populi]RMX06776.1 DNA repair protein RadC [Corticibacter populi]RZS31638.1 DNA repair protein RadC [Corticibacter populi]
MLTPIPIRDNTAEPSAATSSRSDDRIIAKAIALLEQRLYATGPIVTTPQAARDYLRLQLMQEPSEVFAVVFLTTQHQVIACETLFRGSVDTTEIHPRVIVQRALLHNAAALIVSHQHPSGNTTPSAADRALTSRLRMALDLIDVRLLDHLVIGKGEPYSFAYHGLL